MGYAGRLEGRRAMKGMEGEIDAAVITMSTKIEMDHEQDREYS